MTGSSIQSSRPEAAAWLVGGGEMGGLIRSHDWAATPLGPTAAWPQSLRSAVSILLPSRAQICLFWGPDLIAIYNDAYRPALGIKHPWGLGRPAREMWSEFWEDVLRPLLEGVLRTGEALWASDHPFVLDRHGYPEETYFDISYDPVRDESGGVGGVFCIVSETTGRVIGERRLRLLRDLGRAAADARQVEDVFAQAATILGGDPHDIPFTVLLDAGGRPVANAGGPGREARWPLGNEPRVLRGEALAGFELPPGGPWAEPVPAVVIRPLLVPGREPLGWLVAGVSPRLPLDDAYLDFLDLVASGIASGVAAAHALEEQRAQAETLAALDRAKTAFFSNVSHEFRTPLTLLLGPLHDLLARSDLPAEVRASLETARRNSVRLQKLVDTLLNFSRIEAGRMGARFEPTDLSRLTAQLASNFESACARAGLELRVDCPPLAAPVHVDRGLWEKIVLNLLSNAFKFTFDGRIEVSLRDEGDGVALRVADTGTGIPEHELPRLFERFHRVEGARARTHEGSGIGLAFVHELVRMHGGAIDVDSAIGRGTTFTIRLPRGTSHLPADRIAAGSLDAGDTDAGAAYREEAAAMLRDAPPAPPAPDPARPCVLVVDDNADMRDYLSGVLGARWRVRTAVHGRAALEQIESGDCDLVLSDVMMPVMDGFELLRVLKASPATAHLPVVLLSARAGEEARTGGLLAGADDYIVKPFTAAQLTAQVGAQLALREARRRGEAEQQRLAALEQQARRDAEAQRENLRTLLMDAPNPFVILRGPRHVIELANRPTCEVWGRSPEEVVGRPLIEALPELEGQGFIELLDGVLATGVPYRGREVPARFRRPDGTTATAHFSFVYTALRDGAGNPEGVLVTGFDVTEEVRAREQMNALREQAESASRAKDDFLAMLSHELRNPLAPIATAIQLMRLRQTDVPELGMLERQMGHLRRLVDDLLDISRITRGKIELRRQPVEVAEVVIRAIELVSPLIEAGSHRIEAAVPSRGLVVHGDAERLAQVVSNLLSNAAKYSESGSPIRISAERAGDVVRLAVSDAGVGIAPGMLERIFEIFVQQRQTLERSAGGLGLGLTIVRNLVDLHGGRVQASSPGPGAGSTFTVELPLVADPAAAEPGAAGPAGPAATAHRIVVVDDNRDAAVALADLLRLLGHEVAVAHDGEAALALCRDFRPRVALIDIGLPGMDGYEVARRLGGADGAGPAIARIAVTGYGLERDVRRSAAAGFMEHFVKPVDLGRLQAVLSGIEAEPARASTPGGSGGHGPANRNRH